MGGAGGQGRALVAHPCCCTVEPWRNLLCLRPFEPYTYVAVCLSGVVCLPAEGSELEHAAKKARSGTKVYRFK